MKAWNMAELRLALDWERQGVPLAEAARRLGRSYRYLCRLLARRRGPRRAAPRRLADCERDLRRLHARGLYPAAIARKLGVGRGTLARWLARLGLAPNPGRARAWGKNFPRGLGDEARLARKLADGCRAGWPGLCPAPARAMTELWLRGPRAPRDLALALGVTPRYARRLLRGLAAAGLARALPGGSCGANGRPYAKRYEAACDPSQTALPRLLAQRERRVVEDDECG